MRWIRLQEQAAHTFADTATEPIPGAVHLNAQGTTIHVARVNTSKTRSHLRGSCKRRYVLTVTSSLFCKATAICTGTMYQSPPSRHALKGYTTSPSQPNPSNFPAKTKKTSHMRTARCETPNSSKGVSVTPSLFPWSQELFGRFFSFFFPPSLPFQS
jgi:hypothetical protein